jgi:L-fucose isomerase-like protein
MTKQNPRFYPPELWVLGSVGDYFGEFMAGGVAVCRIPRLQELMKHVCKHGFEHHVGMVRSHTAAVIAEAVETYLGWELYVHE